MVNISIFQSQTTCLQVVCGFLFLCNTRDRCLTGQKRMWKIEMKHDFFSGEKITSFQYLLSFAVASEQQLILNCTLHYQFKWALPACVQFSFRPLNHCVEYLFLVSYKLISIATGKSVWKFYFPTVWWFLLNQVLGYLGLH